MTCSLYRLFDKSRVLLYVGVAGNPGRRLNQQLGRLYRTGLGLLAAVFVAALLIKDIARDKPVKQEVG
jgi:hypothetical protein